MLKFCKRACHDCPFRADQPPYWTHAWAELNLLWELDPEKVPKCHHSTYQGRHPNMTTDGPPERHVACAGGLLFARNIGLPKFEDPGADLRDDPRILRTQADLLAHIVPDAKTARRNWLALQPEHIQAAYPTEAGKPTRI